jgi:ubiquinone/menaquinone biosynthesis C-methylase UbiE
MESLSLPARRSWSYRASAASIRAHIGLQHVDTQPPTGIFDYYKLIVSKFLHDEETMSQDDLPVSRVTRSKHQAKVSYDRISSWYDLVAGGFETRHRDAAVRKLAAAEGDVVLEIGYGTGHAIVMLAEAVGKSGKVYGIDLSEGMRGITRSIVEEAGLSGRVVLECGDAMQLPYCTGFFDKIFVSFTLELFDTPEIPTVLSECLRTLRGSGRICVVAMSKKGKPSTLTRLYEWLHEKLPNYVDCRPIFVQKSLEDAGFHILDVTDLSLLGLRGELVLAEKGIC